MLGVATLRLRREFQHLLFEQLDGGFVFEFDGVVESGLSGFGYDFGVTLEAIEDEWYYHLRFPRPGKNVTPLLTTVPPESSSKRSRRYPATRSLRKRKRRAH